MATATLDLCPRCHATIRAGQLVCARCGLHLDDARLAHDEEPLLSPKPAPQKQVGRGRRGLIIALLIAALALVGLSVAVSMAQTRTQDHQSLQGPVAVASETATRDAIVTALAPPPSATPEPQPSATSAQPTQVSLTPVSIPTVTELPTLPPPASVEAATADAASPTPKPILTAPPPATQKPTLTRVAQPTATQRPPLPTTKASNPSPTTLPRATAVTGAARSVNGWTLNIARVESRKELIVSTNPEVKYVPGGSFWMVYLDASNNGSTSRSLGESVDFSLTDNSGTIYLERSGRGKETEVREFARVLGRDYLDISVAPSGTVRTLLVFVMSAESQPKVLTAQAIGSDGKVSPTGKLRINIAP